MKLLSAFSEKKQSMKRKLFGYMFLLAVLLLVLVFAGLLLIGQFTGIKQMCLKDKLTPISTVWQ